MSYEQEPSGGPPESSWLHKNESLLPEYAQLRIETLRGRIAMLETELTRWQEREAAVVSEDYSFEDRIKHLECIVRAQEAAISRRAPVIEAAKNILFAIKHTIPAIYQESGLLRDACDAAKVALRNSALDGEEEL